MDSKDFFMLEGLAHQDSHHQKHRHHMPIKKGLEVRQLVMQFHQAGAKLLNFGHAPYEEQLGLPI